MKKLNLGKIVYKDNVPYVKGADKRVAWSAAEYLAAIIRDYIRMVEKTEWKQKQLQAISVLHRANCAL